MQKHLLPPLFYLFLLSLLFLGACAPLTSENLESQEVPSEEESSATEAPLLPDSSCSYFYLLWGIHAENNRDFQEAEDGLEKALICDPDSRYILKRIPILLLRINKPLAAAQWLQKGIDTFPEDIENRLLLARLAIRDERPDDAIRLYRDVLGITPDDDSILLRIAFLQSQLNRYLEAEKTLHQALQLNPESFFAHLYLARLAKETGDSKQAEQFYHKALALDWSIELAMEVADFYIKKQQYAKAEQQYQILFKKHPEDLNGGLAYVQLLLRQQQEDKAFSVLKKLRAHSNNPEAIDIALARLHLHKKEFATAAEILIPLAASQDNEEAIYLLAISYYEQQKHSDALRILQKIESNSRFFEDILSLQVQILLEEKQFKTAITLLHGAITENKNCSAELYTLLASLYMKQGLFQDSYSTLDAALGVHPNSTKVYFEYGLLLERENKRELALERMTTLLNLDPNHAEALNYVGYTWADMGINLELALNYIQKAIRLKPDDGYIRDSLGWVYYRMGQLARATEEITKALELEPQDPYIHEHLGDIYQKLGEKKKAIKAYKNAQKLFTDKEKQQQMQEQIDGI